MKEFKITTTGKRFDLNSAQRLGPANNCTENQTRGRTLYKTASGNYVLHNWSQWRGEGETWEQIPEKQAMNLAIKYWSDEEIVLAFPKIQELNDEI